jgi:beta-1,4-N-acetylglucosaminyltransferase
MFVLIVAGIIGFAIGRAISLVVSQLFQQHVSLNIPKARTLIVLGSGGNENSIFPCGSFHNFVSFASGHTTEMLEIVKKLKTDKYSPRFYVVAENDQNSVDKLMAIEKDKDEYKIYMISRSRKVHQSYVSSIFTTLKSILDCLPLLMHARPDLILCNGPATCVPVCLVAFFLKVFYINSRCKIAFIESYCRVKSLSLSGWILLYFSDIFVVQWPKISKISRKVLYFGRLT